MTLLLVFLPMFVVVDVSKGGWERYGLAGGDRWKVEEMWLELG